MRRAGNAYLGRTSALLIDENNLEENYTSSNNTQEKLLPVPNIDLYTLTYKLLQPKIEVCTASELKSNTFSMKY